MTIFLRDRNLCPVCGYRLRRPASDCDICPSCGTQFGYSDSGRTHDQLRDLWIERGANWHSCVHPVPRGWNAELQLIEAGFGIKRPNIKLQIQLDAIINSTEQPSEVLERTPNKYLVPAHA
jgi:hypothetical protein